MTTETTTIYCDNCGEPQQKNALLHYQHLPYDVASSYKGESASVCADCDEALKEKKEKMETTQPKVERSHRTAIRAKWLPKTDRIMVSRLDGYERMYVDWDCTLDVGENYANAIQRFVKRMDWSGVWIVGSTDDGAVAVWKGHE